MFIDSLSVCLHSYVYVYQYAHFVNRLHHVCIRVYIMTTNFCVIIKSFIESGTDYYANMHARESQHHRYS